MTTDTKINLSELRARLEQRDDTFDFLAAEDVLALLDAVEAAEAVWFDDKNFGLLEKLGKALDRFDFSGT